MIKGGWSSEPIDWWYYDQWSMSFSHGVVDSFDRIIIIITTLHPYIVPVNYTNNLISVDGFSQKLSSIFLISFNRISHFPVNYARNLRKWSGSGVYVGLWRLPKILCWGEANCWVAWEDTPFSFHTPFGPCQYKPFSAVHSTIHHSI